MAALVDPVPARAEIVDLRELTGRELDPLLLEETVEWQSELDWDFGRSAELVHQFADMKALMGYGLLDRGEIIGYCYSVIEEQKGLIGDIYIRKQWRDGANEARLFRSILDALIAIPQIRRIESQLMLMDAAAAKLLQRERFVKVQERMLLRIDTASMPAMQPGSAAGVYRYESWTEQHHEPSSHVIAQAYQNHVDSHINDQYRTVPGARRFIYNIVTFPGCGRFFRSGSFVAVDRSTGHIAGVVLTSFVADHVGHITQLCIAPQAQGKGLGYELLREAVGALQRHGARRISLTVTVTNSAAIRLYDRCGFREARRFLSYVWERF